MKKINVHPDLLRVITSIVENNDGARTKVAQTILELVNNGMDEESFIDNPSDYFAFSVNSKRSISYVHKEKMVQKLKSINEITEVSDELFNEFNESFFTTSITRTSCKPSKILKRLFKPEFLSETFTNTDVERFVNQYISVVRNEIDFEIVKGEDIRKFYHENTYDNDGPSGSLLNSCMKQEQKQKFLDVYTKNDNVEMLVAFNDNKKVIGRAIIWDKVVMKERDTMDVVHSNVKFMDRIYFTNDWLMDKFVSYAKERGIFTKYSQRHDDIYRIINPKGEEKDFVVEVPVESLNFKYLPYLDTLYVPNYKRGFITNKTDGYDSNCSMRSHDAGIPRLVWDSIEGKLVNSSDSNWTDFSKSWIHRDDSIEVSGDNFHKKLCIKDRLKGFITPKDTAIKCVVSGDEFAERNMITSDYHGGMVHKKEAVETMDAGIVHKEHSVESKYLGSMLSKDGSVRLEKLDDFLPKSILENGVTVDQFEKVIETLNVLKGEEGKSTLSDSSTFVFEF